MPCFSCGLPADTKCGGCDQVVFCDEACKKASWQIHANGNGGRCGYDGIHVGWGPQLDRQMAELKAAAAFEMMVGPDLIAKAVPPTDSLPYPPLVNQPKLKSLLNNAMYEYLEGSGEFFEPGCGETGEGGGHNSLCKISFANGAHVTVYHENICQDYFGEDQIKVAYRFSGEQKAIQLVFFRYCSEFLNLDRIHQCNEKQFKLVLQDMLGDDHMELHDFLAMIISRASPKECCGGDYCECSSRLVDIFKNHHDEFKGATEPAFLQALKLLSQNHPWAKQRSDEDETPVAKKKEPEVVDLVSDDDNDTEVPEVKSEHKTKRTLTTGPENNSAKKANKVSQQQLKWGASGGLAAKAQDEADRNDALLLPITL